MKRILSLGINNEHEVLQARGSRIPPPHCSSPERVEDVESDSTNSFANSINPLMSFTQEEIEFMDKEVNEDMEDMVFEDEEDADDAEEYGTRIRRRSSDSEDSMNGRVNFRRFIICDKILLQFFNFTYYRKYLKNQNTY